MDITERFLKYTQFDTQSSEESQTVPSTSKQLIFAKYLKEELEREGMSDVEMDEPRLHLRYAEGKHEEEYSDYWLHLALRHITRLQWSEHPPAHRRELRRQRHRSL